MASNVSMFYTKKELALKESAERKKGKRVFYLESDGWNDYGYETLFELYWTDEDNKFHEIGPVKIAHKSEKITRDLLENSFSRLEENFCSLGISLIPKEKVEKKYNKPFSKESLSSYCMDEFGEKLGMEARALLPYIVGEAWPKGQQ